MTVTTSFLLVEDSCPCLAFDIKENVAAFVKAFDGRAEIYTQKTYVFLNKPKDLELVKASPNGEMSYVFKLSNGANTFARKLQGHRLVLTDTVEQTRTVLIVPVRRRG
jgi:hypothetical protein